MIQVLISLAAFVVALGIMVTVHEYGHYWVARRCGVRVLRFSVGFGRPLWRRTYGADRTEWRIGAVPLGGYVKMLDEREVEVDPGERHRAFNRQPVGRRAAVVSAGPLVNIALALVAYAVMFMIGVQGVAPLVGSVEPDSAAAAAGFERGDRLVAVAGEPTPTWGEARLTLLDRALSGDAVAPVRVRREERGGPTTRRLALDKVSLEERDADPVRMLGFRPWLPELPARISDVNADSPAAAAGLQAGDTIVRAGGEAIDGWRAWVDFVQARPEQTIPVVVMRSGERIEREVVPRRVQADGETIGRIGARGPSLSAAERERMFTTVHYGPLEALGQTGVKTWDITTLTLRVLWGLVTGTASLSNISGPVTIAQYAGQTAQIGLAQFLGFLGLISISIGILNLMPIPVLDGGHLLFYAIEAIKGSPVSEQAQAAGQQIGLMMLFALMALALYNDLIRLVY
jgi:regulator of sigma E protease